MPLPKRSNSLKDPSKRPIIVKRVRKAQGGHRSTAWKVAYADFVTAMMAFFLLLWLLSTSSKATLEGLSEYFTPTAGVSELRPLGVSNASPTPLNAQESGINLSSPGVMQAQAGSTEAKEVATPSPVDAQQEDNLFAEGAAAIRQAMQQDPALAQYRDNVDVGQTPEGLRIDVKDSDKFPMFDPATSGLTEHGRMVLTRLVPLIKRMPNYMSITGYTEASARDGGGLSRWELSARRATEALQYLVRAGLEAERPQKVVGAGDTELLLPGEPRSPRNRRIRILMVRGSHILIPHSAVPRGATKAN